MSRDWFDAILVILDEVRSMGHRPVKLTVPAFVMVDLLRGMQPQLQEASSMTFYGMPIEKGPRLAVTLSDGTTVTVQANELERMSMSEYKYDPMLGARVRVTSWETEAEKAKFLQEGQVTDLIFDKAHVVFDDGTGIFLRRNSLTILRDQPTEQPNKWFGNDKSSGYLPPTPSMSREEAIELERLEALRKANEMAETTQPFTEAEVTEYFLTPRHASRFTFYLSSIGYFMWDMTYLVRETGEYVIKVGWARNREAIVKMFDERPDLTLELVTKIKARCYVKTDMLFLDEPNQTTLPLD